MHLSPEYWIEKTQDAGNVIRSPEWIEAFNAASVRADANMVDLFDYPGTVPGAELLRAIQSVSKPYGAELCYRDHPDQRRITSSDYARYRASLALDDIQDTVTVKYGLMLARSNMRSWPTRDFAIRSQDTRDLDRFQENALFPGELVVVLHESADKLWYFVRSYNYHAWIRKVRIVTGPKEQLLDYARSPRFLVVTGARAATNYNPQDEATSELQLDMGVRLPLPDPAEIPGHVDGQNAAASHVVRLPVRSGDGPGFKNVLVGRGQDVREGYLPYTRENIIRQAFKFLGERYGWGHSYNARDCTGLVLDIYRTFGIRLPRNSSQQGHSPIGDNVRFGADATREDRLEALKYARAGDLLYAPGHVMIFLGFDAGEPWVIHHMSGSGWVDAEGKPIDGVMNSVAVTPLLTTEVSPGLTYFEEMYAIKKLR